MREERAVDERERLALRVQTPGRCRVRLGLGLGFRFRLGLGLGLGLGLRRSSGLLRRTTHGMATQRRHGSETSTPTIAGSRLHASGHRTRRDPRGARRPQLEVPRAQPRRVGKPILSSPPRSPNGSCRSHGSPPATRRTPPPRRSPLEPRESTCVCLRLPLRRATSERIAHAWHEWR